MEDLRRNELTDYGAILGDGIRARLAAIALPVPVQVVVDGTIGRGAGLFGIEYPPGDCVSGGILEEAITDVVADIPRPDTLPGTLLTRAEG